MNDYWDGVGCFYTGFEMVFVGVKLEMDGADEESNI